MDHRYFCLAYTDDLDELWVGLEKQLGEEEAIDRVSADLQQLGNALSTNLMG